MSCARRHSTNVCPGNRVRYNEGDHDFASVVRVYRCRGVQNRHSVPDSEPGARAHLDFPALRNRDSKARWDQLDSSWPQRKIVRDGSQDVHSR